MALKLPREAFLAIAAVGWSDGWMRKKEAAGLLRAARVCGLDGADLAEVEAAAAKAPSLETLDLSGVGAWEAAVTYAIAVWLAKLDGVVNAEELANLRTLRDRFGVPQPKLDAAASAAFDVTCLPGGASVDSFDFEALEARLREKLPALSVPPAAG
ncbi:MAG: hypothetical protein IT376_23100 [Polyangiaceae bacterium]|nr:hypothetical protein [Polyangiaceae bacterium]